MFENVEQKKIVKPVQKRLIYPLIVMLLILIFSFIYFVRFTNNKELEHINKDTITQIKEEFNALLDSETKALRVAQKLLLLDKKLHKDLKAKDFNELYRVYSPVFNDLKKTYGISHFYFHDIDRRNLLRVHKLEKKGDKINRWTAIEAEKTQKAASGIELGPLGTFTLRLVQPVFYEDKLVGYLELGKETENILSMLHASKDIDLSVHIKKEYLKKNLWEEGMKMLGRESFWGRCDKDVSIYTSFKKQHELYDFCGTEECKQEVNAISFEEKGKTYSITQVPLVDCASRNVGKLVVMKNITENLKETQEVFVLIVASMLFLTIILILFFYKILQKVDMSLTHQVQGLEKSELRFKTLSNSATEAIVFTEKSIIKDVNSALEKMFGYSKEEVLGKSILKFLTEEMFEQELGDKSIFESLPDESIEMIMKKILNDDNNKAYGMKKSGEIFPVRVVGKTSDEGNIRIISILDMSKQREIEKQLQDNESRFRALSNATTEAVFFSQDGICTDVNNSAEQMFGHLKLEAVGMYVFDFIAEKDRDAILKDMISGREGVYEVDCLRKNGSIFQGKVISKESSDGMTRITIVSDITDVKKKEMILLDAKKEAQDASIAKSLFLANMSHEIRSPMNGVVGALDILNDLGLEEEHSTLVDIALKSSLSLLGVINDILDYSKIEAGKLHFEEVDIKPKHFIEDFVHTAKIQIDRDKVAFSHFIDQAVPEYIKCDPNRLKQILINLLSNAIKFTKRGSIDFSCCVEQELEELIVLRFEVKDTGIGIEESAKNVLFDEFTQAEKSTTRKYGGTGLGLSICKKLVFMMNGDIGVDSELGKGSSFWFTISLQKSLKMGSSILREAVVPLVMKKRAKILIVDDDEINRRIMQNIIELSGHEFEMAEDGGIAFEKLKANKYDIVLMDIRMPIMNGIGVTKAVRGDEANKNNKTPILAITANVMEGDEEQYLAVGMTECISKPIRKDFLIETINKYL